MRAACSRGLEPTTADFPRSTATRPGGATEQPEITRQPFGNGQAVYCATLVELLDNAESAVVNLIQGMCDRFQFETEAAACVEVTVFRQADRKRFVMSLLNFQQEMPNLPSEGIKCRLNFNEAIQSENQLVTGEAIPFRRTQTGSELTAPRLETLIQLELVWG